MGRAVAGRFRRWRGVDGIREGGSVRFGSIRIRFGLGFDSVRYRSVPFRSVWFRSVFRIDGCGNRGCADDDGARCREPGSDFDGFVRSTCGAWRPWVCGVAAEGWVVLSPVRSRARVGTRDRVPARVFDDGPAGVTCGRARVFRCRFVSVSEARSSVVTRPSVADSIRCDSRWRPGCWPRSSSIGIRTSCPIPEEASLGVRLGDSRRLSPRTILAGTRRSSIKKPKNSKKSRGKGVVARSRISKGVCGVGFRGAGGYAAGLSRIGRCVAGGDLFRMLARRGLFREVSGIEGCAGVGLRIERRASSASRLGVRGVDWWRGKFPKFFANGHSVSP